MSLLFRQFVSTEVLWPWLTGHSQDSLKQLLALFGVVRLFYKLCNIQLAEHMILQISVLLHKRFNRRFSKRFVVRSKDSVLHVIASVLNLLINTKTFLFFSKESTRCKRSEICSTIFFRMLVKKDPQSQRNEETGGTLRFEIS